MLQRSLTRPRITRRTRSGPRRGQRVLGLRRYDGPPTSHDGARRRQRSTCDDHWRLSLDPRGDCRSRRTKVPRVDSLPTVALRSTAGSSPRYRAWPNERLDTRSSCERLRLTSPPPVDVSGAAGRNRSRRRGSKEPVCTQGTSTSLPVKSFSPKRCCAAAMSVNGYVSATTGSTPPTTAIAANSAKSVGVCIVDPMSRRWWR